MYTLHFKLEETGNLRHNDTTDKNLQHLLFHQILASSAASKWHWGDYEYTIYVPD